MLEHVVCSNIMVYLDKHKLLPDRQHAFSCETQLAQLITVINDWDKSLDNKGQVVIHIEFLRRPLNPLKVNCSAMENFENRLILSCTSDNSELL